MTRKAMRYWILSFCALWAPVWTPGQTTEAETPLYGPAKGTLVIVGGGDDRGTGIMETFVNRAGGLGARIVVVPTANGNKTDDGQIKVYLEDEVVGPWKRGL